MEEKKESETNAIGTLMMEVKESKEECHHTSQPSSSTKPSDTIEPKEVEQMCEQKVPSETTAGATHEPSKRA